MRKALFISMATVLLGTPAFSASLQDWEFNINGTDYYPSGGSTFASVPGLNTSGYSSSQSLGSFAITYTAASTGTFYVGAYFDDPAGVPFYNEFGTQNGSAATGQTWQIDIPEYSAVSKNLGPGTIVDNLANASLDDTNHVPGGTSNFLLDCGANAANGTANTGCNDFVSMATGFSFSLSAGQTETITFTLSATNPGGFSLEDTNTEDTSNNNGTSNVFLSGSAVAGSAPPPPPPPPPPGTPEPATWGLFATAGGILALGLKRKGFRK